MQPISHEIWDSKYRLKDADGNPIDRTLDDTFERVAGALANVEEKPDKWYEPFLWALKNGAVPAGRIMSNAGAQDHKPGTSLINCLAAGTPVLTREGVRPIEGLVGRVVEVLNGNGRWTPVQFQSFGLQKTYATIWRWASNKRTRITVRATADHRWFLTDGRVITTEYWLTAPHLPLRCRTVPHIRPKEVNIEASEWRRGLIHGLVFGDGTQYCGYSTLSLCGDKLALVTLVGELTGVKPNFYTSESGCPVARFHLSGEFNQVICDDFKRLPTGCSDGYLVGFFSGLLATDGTVAKNNRGCQISIFGTHELVEFLIAQLPVVGIGWTFKRRAGVRGDKTNLGVRSKDLWTLSFQPSTVDDRFILRPEHQAKFKNTRDGDLACTRWILHSIDTTPVLEEVFCCSEPETTAFVLASGLKTGQCVVSDTIPDSMEGILAKLAEAGLSLKAGCGIGYEFSTLRPKGAKVMGPGAYTSGPLPFMDVFDALCTTVSSAGGRRGAQMATFDASHPDVLDFIRAKRQDGRLRQFNLSLLVSDRLMDAVKAGAEWPLGFPGREEVYPSIQASALWDEIMRSTYEYAEPGVLLIDRINQYNNLWWCEDIRATNPCCAEGTLVATPAGYRRVETIRMDDKICTAYGGIGRVEAVEVHEDMPVYEVTLDNGISIEVTLSHIFHSQFNHHIGRGWSQEHRLCDLRIGDLLRVVDEGVDRGVPIVGIKYSRNTRVFDLYEPTTDTWVTEGGVVSRGCGEQPLPPYGACLLGSVDLTRFVRNPLSHEVQFDWSAYRKVVSIFTRMLDNVVEIANLPLPEQREELRRKRRHGMGVLGLGSAMAMLGIRYGSSESCSFTGTVMRVMAEVGWEEAVQLAVEKGPAPIMGECFEISEGMLEERPGLRDLPFDKLCGSTLFARGSIYMHKLGEVYPAIVEDLANYGARFTHHTSIAPTGTIALAFANNASNGIEPSFAHQYTRNLTKQGRKTREAVEVYSAEALLWQEKYGNEPYPDYFVTAEQVSPKEHIDVQAAAQQWVDSSISKTINCPTGMSFEEFKEVYQYAYEKGLKGCATFRFNPEFQQGILVTAENLANTQYRFRLDDGTLIEARGDEVLEYEGESHSVANLYDALKEGRYGRY